MMEYKLARYNDYKDSEINCLGEVPRHWETKRIQDITTRVGDGLHSTPNYVDSSGYHFINGNNLVEGRILITENTKCISKIEFEKYKIRISNRAILLSINGTIGNLALYRNENIVLGKSAAYINLKNMTNRRYIYFFLQSITVLNFFATTFAGTTINNLSLKTLRTTDIPFPPLSEQKAIADYLDTKTAQIDQKIDLLTQKATQYGKLKQSLINETVTRGLDKTVAMKDSSVAWIGKVPEHWKIKRVKELFVESKRKSTTGEETLLSVSEYSGVTQKKDNIEKDAFLTNATTLVGYKICRVDELVINIMLTWKRGLGVSPFDGIVSPSYAVYSPNKLTCSAYFHYLFRSERAIVEFKRNSTGIIESRLRLYTDSFYALSIAIPKYEEQQAIAYYLDTKTSHIDRIIETINTQISKLKELRKSLINDVVTGKIKVTMKGEAV